jgi:hypothetical protein
MNGQSGAFIQKIALKLTFQYFMVEKLFSFFPSLQQQPPVRQPIPGVSSFPNGWQRFPINIY